MNILLVHQNFPGQYRELAAWLGAQGRHRVLFLTQRDRIQPIAGVTVASYKPHHRPAADAYVLSRHFEEGMGTAYGAMLAARKIRDEGFTPDIIVGHAGWGELTFLKDVWPDTPVIGLWEYYYLSEGGSVGFDPEYPATPETVQIMQSRNALAHLCLPRIDLGHAPTEWQMDTFPPEFRARSYVCHDGIRTDRLRADPAAAIGLSRLGRRVTRADEVFTYMARNMEPTRGFHSFMRALPRILDARPQARALIVGGSEVSYGAKSTAEGGYRAELERELGDSLDWSRVHFLGRLPYDDYRRVIQISRCHIYLTVPFVLSWSLLEAMSMEAVIVASDTAPVREVIRHGKHGLLADFLSPEAIAAQVVEVLRRPDEHAELGRAARGRVRRRYDFLDRCLPTHIGKMNDLLPRAKRIQM